MPVEILATGTTTANSTTVTVGSTAPIAPVTITLKSPTGQIPYFVPASGTSGLPAIFVQTQDDSGAWQVTGEELTPQKPYILLKRPGVYRIRRLPIDGAPSGIGVFRSDP